MQFGAGVVKSKRSLWRLKTITDFFWAIVNIIGVFFATMFSVIFICFLIPIMEIMGNLLCRTYVCSYDVFIPQMEKSDAYRKGAASGKKWDGGAPGGPGGGGGGPYGGGPRGPPRGGLDNVRGMDSIRGRDHGKFILSLLLSSFDY